MALVQEFKIAKQLCVAILNGAREDHEPLPASRFTQVSRHAQPHPVPPPPSMAFPIAPGAAAGVAAGPRLPVTARRTSFGRAFGRPQKSRVQGAAPRARARRAFALANDDSVEESDEAREARLTAEAVRLVEFRLLRILPAELLNGITVPQKLTEIRSFVRWEEAGKPENMPREWQIREYQAALVDLKLEMLAGGNLNDVRRRYNLDTEFGEDAPLHVPSPEQLEMLRRALDVTKEPEYYAPEKIEAIERADAAEVAKRVEASKKAAKAQALKEKALEEAKAKLQTEAEKQLALAEEKEAATSSLAAVSDVAALELAFESDVEDIGKADAERAVEAEDELAARIAAAAGVVVEPQPRAPEEVSAAASASEPAPETLPAEADVAAVSSSADAADAALFGEDELAVLKVRVAEEAAVTHEKAKVKADAARKVKAQMEALAAKAKAKQTPAEREAAKLAAAKRAAEADLAAAREEMLAARAALEASAATVVQKDAAAREKIATDAAAKKNQTAAGGGLSPAPPKEAPAPAPASPLAHAPPVVPPAAAAPPPAAKGSYGTKKKAADVEAKQRAKELLAAQKAADAKAKADAAAAAEATKKLEARRAAAAAASGAAEAEAEKARVEAKFEEAVANAVAQKALELEELHALAMQTLEAEHKTALIAAKAASAGEAGADASPSEKQLREKLGEAVGALEVSNAQCKSLKKKLAESRGELAKVKNITAKAAEVLESRGADQKLIKSLKKELDVALELEAAAEKRAEYAEKEAAKLKAQSLSSEPKGSLDVLQLEKELEEAHEVIAEFKASWEADRKVIAILSKMKDASPDAPDARDDAKRASEAASESAAKSANLWDLAKKYGKKTLALIGAEEGEAPGGEASGVRTRDVAAETLRASAAKRNNTLAAGPGFPASGPGEYSRVGGSATIKRLRQNAETNEAFVDEGARVRQLKWLAAAEQATEAATAYVEPPAAPAAPASAPASAPAVAAAPASASPPAPESPPAPPAPPATQSNNAVPAIKAPRNLPERVAAKVGAAPPAAPAEAAAAATPPPAPATPPPAAATRRSPTAPLDVSPPVVGASGARGADAAPFTPSIVIPPAKGDDEPKGGGGGAWSAAHLPPGR